MRTLLLIAILSLSLPGIAAADTLQATRGQNLAEAAHTVDVEVRGGLAYYKVRRVFRNRGKVAEEARLEISLPFGAVATGLRIKGKRQWHVGELMHARKAEELYVKLTGMGPSEPKDPALLYWRWTDELALRVFPIFPGKTSTIEYTLTAPTTYQDGTYYFGYGRKPTAKNLATPVLRVRGAKSASIEIDGRASKRKVRLDALRLHPVLVAHGIKNPRVLVRSLTVADQKEWAKATLEVDIRHTWRGDLQISLVSPDGALHELRSHNLSDGGNDLKASYPLAYGGDPNGTWHLLVTDHHPLDGGTLKRWSVSATEPHPRKFRGGKPAFIPQPSASRGGLATVGVRFKPDTTVLRLGRVDLLPKKQFARFEIDVARRLSKLPRPLSVSFVIDASHTMGKAGIAAQLDLVGAYLGHVPWAKVSLTVFGRRAAPLTNGFVPARQFAKLRRRLLNSQALLPRNGSFMDRGIDSAVPGLARRKGSRALVMMTDDRLRTSWANAGSLARLRRLPKDVIVHVVDVAPDGDFRLRRDDQHRLFPLAKLRKGVAVVARGIREAKRSDLVASTLYLVRPNRLDHVKVEGMGAAGKLALNIDLDTPGNQVLPEGSGARWMRPVTEAPISAALTAQLWSKPVRFEVGSQEEPFNQATAGFVFSQDLYDDLSEAEQLVLAMYARVVSPVTSYLAIEPGVRPSTIGLVRTGLGWGSIGSGMLGTIGHGGGSGINWRAIANRIARACGSSGLGSVEAALQLQSHEIADIQLQTTSGNGALDRCVIEALWKERIPRRSSNPRTWSKLLTVRVDGWAPRPSTTP